MLIFVRPSIRSFVSNLSRAVNLHLSGLNLQAISQESVSSQRAVSEHSESTQKALMEPSESTQQRASIEHSEHQNQSQYSL